MKFFTIGNYRFMFGPCRLDGATIHSPLIDGFCLWMWNGHYWHIEIANASDLEGAKYTMQFILADRKAALVK